MTRLQLFDTDLKLPPCGLARPGESVAWYSDSSPCRGTLLGHNSIGAPVVQNRDGFTYALGSFDELRLVDASNRVGPSWTRMGGVGRIYKPFDAESEAFSRLLARRIPPGPSYLELIQEIWHRGFEAFLVGGTVRDVISGQPAHDVDVVTSMPLARALPLLTSMYRYEPSLNGARGFLRLGGTPASGDPFIDLKAMVHSQPGTPNAIFSSDLLQDLRHRDFACNAVYYDPINDALVDPAGCGVNGAEAQALELVADPDRPPFYRAQICIRYFKFLCRGYHATESTSEMLVANYFPSLPAMKRSGLVTYLRAQVLSKSSDGDHHRTLSLLKEAMQACGAGLLWKEHIEPILDEIIPDEGA